MAEQLWIPSFFKSGMILQQQVVNLLHGRAWPEASVSLTIERRPFDGRAVSPLDNQYGLIGQVQTTCGEDGSFTLKIPAYDASFDPFTLTVTAGKSQRIFMDVLFGELWIAGGQSNMQMPLSACLDAAQLKTLANLYYVRVLSQKPDGLENRKSTYAYHPHADLAGAAWHRGDQPEEMAGVSAIGFSFARELHLELKIPVGLIETALRGTHIHSWLSRTSIESDPALGQHIRELGCYRSEQDWNLTGDAEWARQQPSALYNSKIAPLRGIGARGIIWHHGETDYQYPDYYQRALKAMTADWQQVFRPADPRGLALLLVQLKPHFHGHYRFQQLAEFNEMLAAVRHSLPGPTALVPIYDLPLDYDSASPDWRSPLHPLSKLPVGQRLCTVALGLLYQRKAPSSAPECASIELVGGKMMLSFSNIGDGLRLTGEETRLRGFTICGPERIFVEAQARILYGLKVLVWHDQISDPSAVAYAHADLNNHANLISRDRLPVVPFRSDREPARLIPPQEWLHCDHLNIWCCPQFAHPEQTGWHPAWHVERGNGKMTLDKANKTEGDASILYKYENESGLWHGLEPALAYDSLFPPLDLSSYDRISIDVFNPDLQSKQFKLALAAGPADAPLLELDARQLVQPALRWQRLTFDLTALDSQTRAMIRRIVFLMEDRQPQGSVFIDNIRLILE